VVIRIVVVGVCVVIFVRERKSGKFALRSLAFIYSSSDDNTVVRGDRDSCKSV
jgi:hypothetical protein